MNERVINAITRVAEYNGWGATHEETGNGTRFEFSKYTPAGQDFFFSAETEKGSVNALVDDIDKYIDDFDPDYEASLWIGEDGHGKNGAPYHIKDIVRDFENARDMMDGLLEAFENLRDTMEENGDDGKMCVFELTDEQLCELKQYILDEKLREREDRCISYDEIVQIGHYVSDNEVFNKCGDVTFMDDDFFCTANKEED